MTDMRNERAPLRGYYYGILDEGEDGYGVVFPDFPGCTAMGKTLEEVKRNAANALKDWVEEYKLMIHPFPKDSCLLEVVADLKASGRFEEDGLIMLRMLVEF